MFDIDKLNLFWTSDYKRMFGQDSTEVPLDRQLLQKETEILLHPRNVQHLLMPLGNDIFVQDLYRKEFDGKYVAKDSDTMFSILNPMTNVKKAIIFVKGKFAVGIGAKGITFHALNQVNTEQQSINDKYLAGYEVVYKKRVKRVSRSEYAERGYKEGNPIMLSTALRFEGIDGKRFGNYTDSSGNLVSEIMSQLLTMYVDGVKEPYAVLMNITMQTANVVDYLIKAGLSAKTIVEFLSQPLIKDYLLAQKVNESLFIKNDYYFVPDGNGGGEWLSREKKKADLLQSILKDTYVDPEALVGFTELPSDWKITNLKDSLVPVGEKPDYNNREYFREQVFLLQHFLEIQELSKMYGHFLSTQDSDTGKFSSIQDVLRDGEMRGIVLSEGLVDPSVITEFDTTGVVSPFYQYGRRSYNTLFNQFYQYVSNSPFSGLLNTAKFKLAEKEKGENKDRLMRTMDNDFLLFLIHNYYFDSGSFDRLMRGDNSVAKRVKLLKEKIPSNMLLKALQPIIGLNSDSSGSKIDNLRLFEKNLESSDSNDITKSLLEIQEIDNDLYKDIIHVLYFQNGLNAGIYNYFKIVPIGLNKNRNSDNEHEYITQDVIKSIQGIQPDEVFDLWNKFLLLFDLNNPQFVKKQQGVHQIYKTYSTEKKSIEFFRREPVVKNGKETTEVKPVKLLGSKSMKRYNLAFLDVAFNSKPVESKPESMDDYLDYLQSNPSVQQVVTINEAYNLLGKKTKSDNVVIQNVYQKTGVEYAKSIGGIFSMRVSGSNKHFGNPFSSVKSEIDKGLIPTRSTEESVKKYIDWVVNSNDERSVWIRGVIKSGQLKNKPIVYYKELNEPSHATALDYLINKYDWSNTTLQNDMSSKESVQLSLFDSSNPSVQQGIDNTLEKNYGSIPFKNLSNDEITSLEKELKSFKNNLELIGEKVFRNDWLKSEIIDFELLLKSYSTYNTQTGVLLFTEYIPTIAFIFTDNNKEYKGEYSLAQTNYTFDSSFYKEYEKLVKRFYFGIKNVNGKNLQKGIDNTLNEC